jgi:hypothetical protein
LRQFARLGTDYAECAAQGINHRVDGDNQMTNIQSAIGASVWMAVAALLMLATLEPVTVASDGAELAAASTDRAHG